MLYILVLISISLTGEGKNENRKGDTTNERRGTKRKK